MKLFSCQGCGQLLYFENVLCEACGRPLGYLTDLTEISALEPIEGGGWTVLAAPGQAYKFYRNYDAGMCNWMLPADNDEDFCAACRHNGVAPDLSVPGNDALWRKIETATNSLNRSMGLTDLYPFVISARVIEKLGFIHALAHRHRAVLRKAS